MDRQVQVLSSLCKSKLRFHQPIHTFIELTFRFLHPTKISWPNRHCQEFVRLQVFYQNITRISFTRMKNVSGVVHILRFFFSQSLIADQALEFAAKCLFKLNFAEDKKFGEVLESVRNNPDELTFLIFDEAHHSATNNDEKPTPYQEFVNRWFIEDFDNIFCLFLSATPYNLLTNQSRFIMQDTIYNAETKTFIDSDNRFDKSQKFPKYEIRWTLSHITDFRRGWKMRLMVRKLVGIFKIDL